MRVIISPLLLMSVLFSGCIYSSEYRKAKDDYTNSSFSLKKLELKNEDTVTEYKKNLNSKEDLSLGKKNLKKQKEHWRQTLKKQHHFVESLTKKIDKENIIKRIDSKETSQLLTPYVKLESVILIALVNNLDILAAKKEWESSLEKYDQATRLDQIMNQYRSFILANRKGTHGPSVMNSFPLPGVITLKGDIVLKEVMISKEKYDSVVRDILSEVTITYDELKFILESIEITKENLDVLKSLEAIAQAKYGTGDAPFNDVIKIQMEISNFSDNLKTLKQLKKTTIVKLNMILNLGYDSEIGTPLERIMEPVTISLEKLYEISLSHNQEVKIKKLQIEKANLAIELAEKKFYPDFTLAVSYLKNHSFSQKAVVQTMPWFGKNDAYVREARLIYQKMQKELASFKNHILIQLRNLLFQLDKAKREVLLLRNDLLDQAKSAVDVSSIEYEAGKTDFLDVLYAQKKLIDFNLRYKKAIKEYNQGYVNLLGLLGLDITSEFPDKY